MATRLSVFNVTLALLGEPLMSTDLDPGANQDLLRGMWQDAVDVAHEATGWHFAKLRAVLPRLAQVPLFGWQYYYATPPDMLRLLWVSESGDTNDELTQWEPEPGKIATDADAIYIVYVSESSVSNTGGWSATFARYVSTELAVLVGPTINSAAIEALLKERKKAKSDAVGIDATGGPPILEPMGSWSRAARGRGTGEMR